MKKEYLLILFQIILSLPVYIFITVFITFNILTILGIVPLLYVLVPVGLVVGFLFYLTIPFKRNLIILKLLALFALSTITLLLNPYGLGIFAGAAVQDSVDSITVEQERTTLSNTDANFAIINTRNDAEQYYSLNAFSYAGFCDSSNFKLTSFDHQCFSTNNAYAASVQLPDGTLKCVDSSGNSEKVNEHVKSTQCR